MTRRLLLALVSGSFVNPVDYGAETDMRGVYDAVVVGGSLSTVTSATAAFGSGDTGKTYTLADPAGGVTTGTLTFVNSTTATMSTAAGGAMTGARLIFGTDDAAAWQAALDAATVGQIVGIADPRFRSLVGSNLDIPIGVTLGSAAVGPFDPLTNPCMNDWGPTIGYIGDGDPFLTLHTESGVGDLIFYCINQEAATASTPTTMGATIYIEGDSSAGSAGCHIGRPYIANAYDGLRIHGGRHVIDAPQIGGLHRAVIIDESFDTVSIHRIEAHVYWRICENIAGPTAGELTDYALSNAWAFEVNRSDDFMVDQLFCFGYYGGLLMADSPDTGLANRAGYGMVGMLSADGVSRGIYAISTNLLIVSATNIGANSSGVGSAGDKGIATVAGGTVAPTVIVKSMNISGTFTNNTSSGAGTLIVPATNPG